MVAAVMGDVPRGASGRARVAMVILTQRQRQVAASGTQPARLCTHSTLPNPHPVASTPLHSFSETREGWVRPCGSWISSSTTPIQSPAGRWGTMFSLH